MVDAHPRLGAITPQVHLRSKPRRVVQRSRVEPLQIRGRNYLAHDGRAALGTELAEHRDPQAPLREDDEDPKRPNSSVSGSGGSGTLRSVRVLPRSRSGRYRTSNLRRYLACALYSFPLCLAGSNPPPISIMPPPGGRRIDRSCIHLTLPRRRILGSSAWGRGASQREEGDVVFLLPAFPHEG